MVTLQRRRQQATPKILFYDIESAGVNALKSDLGFVIVFGYKWAHEKQAKAITISRKALRHFDDRQLLQRASMILSRADIVVAHYGSVFDRRFIQGRLLINKLPPIPMTKMRDTCMIARSVANFSSNRLKYLAKVLDLRHQKLDNGWPMAWFKVMQGGMAALRRMAIYCRGDVRALEDLYYRLRPFDNAHTRLFFTSDTCSVCGSGVEYRGYTFVNNKHYRRFVCKQCHKWGRSSHASL